MVEGRHQVVCRWARFLIPHPNSCVHLRVVRAVVDQPVLASALSKGAHRVDPEPLIVLLFGVDLCHRDT